MTEIFDLNSKILQITDPVALEVIEYLLKEIQTLKEEVATLKKNSTTSSKPPSSDITKSSKERRKKGKRTIGGQKGRDGKFKLLFSSEDVDEIQDLELEDCPDCQHKLSILRHNKVKIDQNAELPESPVKVTEYRRHGRYCSCCKKVVYPELPEGVISGQLFGPRLQSLIGYMKGNLGSSYSELEKFCDDVLDVKISQGMLAKIVSRVSESLKFPYQEVKMQVPKQELVHIDETGWKDQGERYWIWVFCNNLMAFFTIKDSRGGKVLREVLGEVFSGAIVSDFYSAYTAYANPKQQFCLAHLIRDIKFLTTLPDKKKQEFGKKVLQYFKILFRLWHRRNEYPPGELQKKADHLQRKLGTYLCQSGLTGEALTMQKRLRKHWNSLFRFFTEPEIYQPTNNFAEQTIRHFVRIRKMTQGSRGKTGRDWNARVMTVFQTCRKQKKNPWEFINKAFSAYIFNQNPPKLLAN